MRQTVKALIAHTGAGKWRNIGDTYTLPRTYADIMRRIKKVEIVGESRQGRAVKAKDAAPVEPETDTDGQGQAQEPGAADGASAGENASTAASVAELRAAYTELTGEKPHHLWKEARLLEEIEKARAK
ncbi:hypothetical protein [Rhizobium phage RHph_X2_26]|nr:hypothetical protein [Rhizobium phage RHph_X2_26]